MACEIRVPRLGWSMEEGTFAGWLKQPGEFVSAGEPLFELEGDKALQTVESIDEGYLALPADAPAVGSVIPVGALLGYLLAEGESIPAGSAPAVGAEPPRGSLSPNAPAAVAGSAEVVEAERHVASTPRARRVAMELGIDWRTVTGTGRGGRVREADVRAAYQLGSDAARISSDVMPSEAGEARRRKVIAARLRLSRERTVPVTLTTRADASKLVEYRRQMKSQQGLAVPAYTDILACLASRVLGRHPQMSVRWSTESDSLERVASDAVDIGIAVDTPDGLLVPVVRQVPGKTIDQVTAESQRLIQLARSGRLTAEQMHGAVLTITNLGAFGIDAFTPVLNYPEIAILGMGAIRRVPVVSDDGQIVARHQIILSLTFDHAAVDGAPAAAWLRDLVEAIESLDSHCG